MLVAAKTPDEVQGVLIDTYAVDAGNTSSVDVGNGGSFGDASTAGESGTGSADVSGDISGGGPSGDM